MERRLNITEARKALNTLPEELAQTHATVAVTRRGKPVLAILDWDLFEGMLETMEILGDPELMAQIREAEKDLREGRTIPLEEVARELGL
jgi:PHD/YefM family antitoxin component YafN of YafNO toxin-antitoxin module